MTTRNKSAYTASQWSESKAGRAVFWMAVLALIGSLIAVTASTGRADAAGLPADMVFVIDESGSMGQDIADVKTNVGFIAGELADAGLDAKFGLVGYGASIGHSGTTSNGEPHIHTDFTGETGFSNALGDLVASGGHEPAFDATVLAMSGQMSFRQDAGVCMVLITDEDADSGSSTKADAITALNDQGATFFGIVDPNFGNTANDFGPNAGSLAEQTGGQVFDIINFRQDAQPVLEVLLDGCIQAITGGADVDVHPESCPNPFKLDKRGQVPAAILGSDTLDVSTIDPSTVELVGPDGSASAIRSSIEDVAGPDEFPQPELKDDCGTEGPDGFDDLTLKFDAGDVQSTLGPVEPGDTVVVTITGQTFEGATVSGVDIIWIR